MNVGLCITLLLLPRHICITDRQENHLEATTSSISCICDIPTKTVDTLNTYLNLVVYQIKQSWK